MQSVRRSIPLSVASLIILAGCNFNSPWGSSSSGQDYGVDATATGSTGSGGTGGTGGTGTGHIGVGGERRISGTDDTVVATPSQNAVTVTVGASQTLSIAFTSSDGLMITGFGISGDLATLPAGWSGPADFTCAAVAAGNDCVLNLKYAPTATDSGTLTLNYVYVDNANLSRAPGGSVTIAYQALTQNNIVAMASPIGQINAIAGADRQAVSVNFTTDDGNAATNLALSNNLAALPAGWSSSEASFTCVIVTTGSGCLLPLSYAPASAGRGTLTLNYTYTDHSGAARSGALNIPYATTTANHIVASASPPGQITAVEKTGRQAVAVTFTTDDGRPATNFALTSAGGALPPGWSGTAAGLRCGSASTGNACQLHLTYAPAALTAGTFTLTYDYDDDSGAPRTGSMNLNYAATTNDNAVATASPSGPIDAIVGMASPTVAVTFTTDDGREATALQISTDLSALPAGWSSASSTFGCAAFAAGNGCQLGLTYTPLAYANGTLTLRYTYLNNAGDSNSGSVSIPYHARTNDLVIGTPSQNPLAVLVNTSTPLTITFTTNDGNAAHGLTITSGLAALPAGWSGPGSFACTSVSAGTVCQLALTYAPTAPDNGSLSLGYSYTNNAGITNSGTVTVSFSAT